MLQVNRYGESLKAFITTIIIGAQYVQAAGVALGLQNVVRKCCCNIHWWRRFFSQGDFYEGINYAESLQITRALSKQRLGNFTVSYKQLLSQLKSSCCWYSWYLADGMDPLAVYAVTKKLVNAVAGTVLC